METLTMYNNQATSTRAADELIMNVLRGAGPVGLHIDDITQLIGLPETKDALARLKYLQVTQMVEQKNGQLWKITDMGKQVMAKADPPPAADKTITLPHGTELPSINLPGIGKFNSYKNSFQEYCQKAKLANPVYKVDHKIGVGFIGSVSFGTNSITASRAVSTSKEATMFIAFEALKQLGYFSDEVNYEHTSILRKRKEEGELEAPPAKKAFTMISATFKSRLNELAQKNKMALPTYNTVKTNAGYFSTCTFNDREFKSTSTCAKKKEAEQSAAQVAVTVLLGKVPSEASNGNLEALDGIAPETGADQIKTEGDVTSMILEARTAANKQKESLKNRLQEYCQRLKKDLPMYTTALTSNRSYVSTVVVDGAKYTGDIKTSKKQSETSAAEAALKCLGLMA